MCCRYERYQAPQIAPGFRVRSGPEPRAENFFPVECEKGAGSREKARKADSTARDSAKKKSTKNEDKLIWGLDFDFFTHYWKKV
jgi:hypothetical protein